MSELTIEDRIASRIDQTATRDISVSTPKGGLSFENASQVMEFAKLLSISNLAIPKHLRGNPGACLAIVVQAIEWRLSPYAVANKSYSVNDRLAYESQLIQAVILQRAPIKGRFKVEFKGTGENRVCRVWAELKDSKEIVEYESPPFGRITPKNSPLWKADPDQQHFYYSGRALCRRHFPDVLLGIYARDELEDEIGPDRARDVTPKRGTLGERLDALSKIAPAAPVQEEHDPETGEVNEAVHQAEAVAHPLDIPSDLRRESNEHPKTPEEYIAAANDYICGSFNAECLETRWREEKQLRQRLGVPVSDAKVLGDAVLAKAKELRSVYEND